MLTLEKAKTLIRQKAAVKDHRHELQLHQMGSEAADLGRLGDHKPIQNRSDNKLQQSFFRQRQKGPQCTRCGHDNHLAGDECPTTGAICHKCGKKGYFSAYCFMSVICCYHLLWVVWQWCWKDRFSSLTSFLCTFSTVFDKLLNLTCSSWPPYRCTKS